MGKHIGAPLGVCHMGTGAGASAALCWVDEQTVCIAHGAFVSWCSEGLVETRRVRVPRHAKNLSPFADGGLAVCLEGEGVWIISPEGQVLRRFNIDAPSRVFARQDSTSEQADFAVVRSVRDPEHGFDYSIAERYSAAVPEPRLYGAPGSFDSNLSSTPDLSPNLGVAIAREWWGIRLRPLGGAASELRREGIQAYCLLDDEHLLVGTKTTLEVVALADGSVVRSIEVPNSGAMRLDRFRDHIVARLDRKRLLVVDRHLEVLADREFGANLVGGAPSPDLSQWLLVYCKDDVSPRQLGWAKGSAKPKKHKPLHLETHSVAADGEALYLGAPKSITRLTPSSITQRDLGVGTPHLMTTFGDQLAILGSKFCVATAATLESRHEAKLRYSQTHSALWAGTDRLVVSSGARRVELSDEPRESALRSPCKHVLACVVDGELCYVDNQGWLCKGKSEPVRLLELEEEEWYASAVSRDGETWAIDWKGKGIRVWNRAGRNALKTIPAEPNHDVMSLAFNADATQLAIGRIGRLQLVDVATGESKQVELPGQCLSLAFSPSGRTLFSVLYTHLFGRLGGLVEGEVRAFDTQDLSQRFRLFLAKEAALVIGPDGETEALGKVKTAAQLAVEESALRVAPINPSASGNLLSRALE